MYCRWLVLIYSANMVLYNQEYSIDQIGILYALWRNYQQNRFDEVGRGLFCVQVAEYRCFVQAEEQSGKV